MAAKDKSTSNAEPMTHVTELRPNPRYQLQLEAAEQAAKAPTTTKKEK